MPTAKKKKVVKSTKRAAKATKAETVEVSDGVQLLLGNIMEQKDREYYVETFLKLKAKADTANSHVRDFRKKAKEAGVDMKALTDVLAMERWEVLDLASYLKQMSAFMRDRGLPVQAALFETKYGSVDEQSGKLGWDAGISGRSPPVELFPEGTPGFESMMRQWNSAQRQIVEDGAKD